jgi:hypothetical protein
MLPDGGASDRSDTAQGSGTRSSRKAWTEGTRRGMREAASLGSMY